MIKRFFEYYKPHKIWLAIDLGFSLFISVFNLLFPIFTRNMLYNYIPNNRMDLLLKWSIIMVALFIVQYISTYIVNYYGHGLGVKIEQDMRRDLFAHLQTLSFSYYDRNRTGHIMSRMVNDLRDIGELAHHGPENIFISAVMIVGSFIMLLTIDYRLTFILFSFVPFMIAFVLNRRKAMEKAFQNVRSKIADVNAQIENSISGIRVSKSFSNEDYELEKFQIGNEKYSMFRNIAYKVMAEYAAGMGMIQSFLNLLILFIGGYFVFRDMMTMADLIVFILYINFFMMPIRRLTDFAQQYEDGMAGFVRFIEVMDIKPEIVDASNAKDINNIRGAIKYDNVSFAYDDNKVVLKGINLDIPAGKTVAVVGPSGAGKTTLCHLLPRFYDVTEGNITIDGVDIREIKIESLRKNIGVVQQDVFLFTGTIKDNILYGRPDASHEEVVKASIMANVHEFINDLPDGYDSYIGEKGLLLSGGQKQRIALARIFLKAPPILILDEATSALDNETEKIIQESLNNLFEGRTNLVIAHRLSTIKNADEIIVLTEDGIAEQGNHEQLMGNDKIYARLYKLQLFE
ncbi:MAG: ABC transporter ATP-binding protein [Tissierellia bacterium]|nr:ABC transporter ATP-binding protein [Tissierellia bacterium]